MSLVDEFKEERDSALLSLDEKLIRAFYRKWNDEELPATGLKGRVVTGCSPAALRATMVESWMPNRNKPPKSKPCPHSAEGWCLWCVDGLQERAEFSEYNFQITNRAYVAQDKHIMELKKIITDCLHPDFQI